MSTRTYLLTPPGHKEGKMPSGVLVKNLGIIPELFDTKGNMVATVCNYSFQNYFAECMGEAPAWEGWAEHIIYNAKDRSDLRIVIYNENSWDIYEGERKIDGLSPLDIQKKALAWLLRAGCAKEVSSE